MKVLIVDDDPSLRQMLELTLGMDDRVKDVQCTDNPESALEVAVVMTPDVVIVDSLHQADGTEAGDHLRAALPDAKLISFSGIERGAPWADAHVVKSVDAIKDLKAAIFGDRDATVTPAQPPIDDVRKFIHDLRNPIGALVGFTHVMKSRGDDLAPEQWDKIVGSIDRAVTRLSQIVDEFAERRDK